MWKLMLAPVSAALCLAWSAAQAEQQLTAHTARSTPGEATPHASIEDMAWLAGAWLGSGLGGESEELWSEPRHGEMIGMYRLTREGRPVFYELMTLSERNGSLLLRLKHFDDQLRGWEQRDASQSFRLVARRDGRFYFDSITLEPAGDELTIYLAVEGKDADAPREEVFRYRRAKPSVKD